MKINFMVGEMAKLHGISKQTLQYYDRIDLLKPKEVGGENQYRYYTLEQFEQLDVILSLKDLGMKLEEIKHYLRTSSIDDRMKQLESQQWAIRGRINQLERASRILSTTMHSLKSNMDIIPFEMGIKILEKRYIQIEPVQPPFDWYQLEIAVKKIITHFKHEDNISYNDLLVFVDLNSTRQELSKTVAIELRHESGEFLPEGTYAYMYHKGTYEALANSWSRLFQFIKNSEYEICGDGIEKALLNTFAVANEVDMLIELQVPVKKR